jgi:hypothetical protein
MSLPRNGRKSNAARKIDITQQRLQFLSSVWEHETRASSAAPEEKKQ